MLRPSPLVQRHSLHRIIYFKCHSLGYESRRSFLTSSSPQTVKHTAFLPYPPSALYGVIADISSYPTFLPFCTSASILSWSHSDFADRKWPARASLGIGWGNIKEEYVSRVYCVPGHIVEAIAGEARTGLTFQQLQIYEGIEGMGVGAGGGRVHGNEGGDTFKSLKTKWELRRATTGAVVGSEVDLSIDFEFRNPLYAALSGAAVPKVAAAVVEAFEKRANIVLGGKE